MRRAPSEQQLIEIHPLLLPGRSCAGEQIPDEDGNPRLEVRLGGIYALERIDKESPEWAYHSTVMEVLTAYVRENAPWIPKSARTPDRGFIRPRWRRLLSSSTSNKAAEQERLMQEAWGLDDPKAPSTDIQAILDVIKRRKEDHVPNKHQVVLDLRGTDLRAATSVEPTWRGQTSLEPNFRKRTSLELT